MNPHTTFPGSGPGGHSILSTELLTDYHHTNIIELSVPGVCVCERSGLTQDIKMGSCVFQCEIPHQWIAQPQVGPVTV